MVEGLKKLEQGLIEMAKLKNGAVERTIDVRKILAIVKKNWLVLKSDKIRLLPLLFFPIIMIVLFGYATGNTPKHISAAVVDYDQTDFSRAVQDELSGMDSFSLKYVVSTEDEGKRLLDSGQAKVLFILPEGMSDDVAAGKPAQLEIMVDEADSSVAQMAKSSAQFFVQKLSQGIQKKRLAELSVNVGAARGALAGAKASLSQASAFDAETEAAVSSSENRMRQAAKTFTVSNALIGQTAQTMENSLGYLIDQNEIADSFTPSDVGGGTLAALAAGDSQQATLVQVSVYRGMQATQAKLYGEMALVYADAKKLAGVSKAHAQSAGISATLVNAADGKLEVITDEADRVPTVIELVVLAPYGYGRRAIDFLLPSMLAMIIFQGATMGLGRAIAGEKKDGSLTRVFLTPTSNVSIIFGTQFFYLILETFRSMMLIFAAMLLFGVSISGSMIDIIIIIAIYALGATGVGMVISVLTHNQEQYMAMGMLVSMPIMFLSGVFFPIQTMPPVLQGVANFLPVTYAADALRGVMVKGFTISQVMPDMIALVLFGALTLTASLIMFKRELV